MMLRFFLVVAVAAVAVSADDCCSAEDRKELQYIWKKVWSSSFTDRKVAIAGAVFEEVFNRFPESKALFKRVHVDDPKSGEWRSHLVRVANGLDTIINLMSDPDVLAQQLDHLSNQHVARAGVKAVYFKAIGDAFEHVLSQVSTCFNVEAWDRCFTRVANIISAKLP
jgi:hemoglobin-like flavoprotein